MKLTKLVKTSSACPAQWDAEDEDGNYVYIRYRHGYLYVSTAPTEEEWDYKSSKFFEKTVTEENDGFMSTEEMLEHTGLEYDGEIPVKFYLGGERAYKDFMQFLDDFEEDS